MTIGRATVNDICVSQDSVSRTHATIMMDENGVKIRDNESTNGTYVNDHKIHEAYLKDGDLIKVGRSIFKFLTGDNIESSYHEEIYRLSTVDGLTQIFNKRYFVETLERELSRARRYDRPLALMMFDIDHFKRCNDTFGHRAGDHVLRQVAELVRERARKVDVVARYGGEEFFATILPEIDLEGAAQFGETVRKLVEDTRFVFEGRHIPLTISVGVADLDPAVATGGRSDPAGGRSAVPGQADRAQPGRLHRPRWELSAGSGRVGQTHSVSTANAMTSQEQSLPRVHRLSDALADQIAAGEVIERPASVVKELVDNAIDAGARRVDVELGRRGVPRRSWWSTTGTGFHPDDLELALTRHATSKLRRAADLTEIETLGFRGEALASIAAVAQVRVRSRRKGEPMGRVVDARAGGVQRIEPTGMAVGTRIEVRNLFENVPARRKFLRSEATEVGHVTEAMVRLALVHPQVRLRLEHGRRTLLELSPADAGGAGGSAARASGWAGAGAGGRGRARWGARFGRG